MSFETLYRRAYERFDQETFLLVVFAFASGFALIETFRFGISGAARFPRLTASVVFIGALLLLFSSYLPESLRTAIEESPEVFQADEEFEERQSEAEKRHAETIDEEEREATDISTVGRPIHDSVFGAIIVTLYGLVGFTVGILWATPLFVVAYGYWFKLPRYITAILTVAGFAIAYGFMTVLGVPLDRGEILLTDGVF
ncbi:tripartite tricarboxylate transporter TctB family protein [Halorubrum sp. DTA98]|uniref:tripartite tricarboxylate transporter TctB family protein n=1 Tax=Halorubrum sp. DTA98 TaxID=3402163 RepID=UPI003AABCC5D